MKQSIIIPLRHLQNHVSSFPLYIYNKTYHSAHQLQLLTSYKKSVRNETNCILSCGWYTSNEAILAEEKPEKVQALTGFCTHASQILVMITSF